MDRFLGCICDKIKYTAEENVNGVIEKIAVDLAHEIFHRLSRNVVTVGTMTNAAILHYSAHEIAIFAAEENSWMALRQFRADVVDVRISAQQVGEALDRYRAYLNWVGEFERKTQLIQIASNITQRDCTPEVLTELITRHQHETEAKCLAMEQRLDAIFSY